MNDRNQIPSKNELLEMFEYRDGDLYRKPSKSGTLDGGGYIQTGIKGKYYKNHRLIFMMHHGYCPDYVDHIDGNKLNNKIENLRAATHSENLYNRKFQSNNTSGVKGVSYENQYKKKWKAKISVDGKEISIGRFETLEEAKNAMKEMREKLHGLFSNHG